MTLSQIKTIITAYVAANSQSNVGTQNAPFTPSYANLAGLLDKIAKTITVDGQFADKLEVFNGEELELGRTIEEWYQDLCVVAAYDPTGANALAPTYPTYQDNAYNYSLGRKVIQTTLKYNDYERAFNSPAEYESIVNMVLKRLYDTYAVFKYDAKKQLLANTIAKAEAASNASTLCKVVAAPVDAATGEAFIEEVKKDVEAASFVSEGNSLNATATLGASEGLVLVVKKGTMPALDVNTMAGAFHLDKLAIPAEIIVVDDFGDANSKYYAMLVDKRGIRLHPDYMAVREQMNGKGDFMNFFLHTESTGFISRNTFLRVYKATA